MIQSLCKFLLCFLTGAVVGHHCVVGLLLGLYTFFFYLEQNSTGEEYMDFIPDISFPTMQESN